uniref:Uncharacterized protein n=1 Tax=Anguilla anguilla TaxID=7936 RepID=A0A0E9QKI4_ANGAN
MLIKMHQTTSNSLVAFILGNNMMRFHEVTGIAGPNCLSCRDIYQTTHGQKTGLGNWLQPQEK